MSFFVKSGAATFFFFFAIIFIAIGTIAYIHAQKPRRKKLMGLIGIAVITLVYLLNLLFMPPKTPTSAFLYLTVVMFEFMPNISVLTFGTLPRGLLRLLLRIGFVFFVVIILALLSIIYFFPTSF